jgi:hypothetical protein
MASNDNLKDFLRTVADAIRSKKGITRQINPQDFAREIESIETGSASGGDIDGLIKGTSTSISSDVSYIRSNAFREYTKLSTVNFPNVESIGSYAFYGSGIAEAIFISCTEAEPFALANCSNLVCVSLPSLVNASNDVLRDNPALEEVFIPSCQVIGQNAFDNDYNLQYLTLDSATRIEAKAFSGCGSLVALGLKAPTVCELVDINALEFTPIADYCGFIFVPDELMDAYKSANNWSEYADLFRPLEELPGYLNYVLRRK